MGGRVTQITTGDTTDVPCSEADGCREVELLDGSGRVEHALWVAGPLSRVERLVATLNQLAREKLARDILDAEFSAARVTGRRLDKRIREVYDQELVSAKGVRRAKKVVHKIGDRVRVNLPLATGGTTSRPGVVVGHTASGHVCVKSPREVGSPIFLTLRANEVFPGAT